MVPELFETQGGACAICGQAIDLGADGRRGDGATLDHAHPRHDGGDLIPADPALVRLVHNRCNVARGNRTRARSLKFGTLRDQPANGNGNANHAATKRNRSRTNFADENHKSLPTFLEGGPTCPTSDVVASPGKPWKSR